MNNTKRLHREAMDIAQVTELAMVQGMMDRDGVGARVGIRPGSGAGTAGPVDTNPSSGCGAIQIDTGT